MNKKLNSKISRGLSLIAISPILVNSIGGFEGVEAEAKVYTSSIASSSRVSMPKYKLSRMEKVMGGITLGVGSLSLVGTAVGIGLTESQYEQTKKTYDDIVDRTYQSFYDDRERYMQNLFNQWGVPMPDKYKNPIKKDEVKPSPGFDFGG